MRFNSKIAAIEEMFNLKDLNMGHLHGTLTTYGMRLGMDKFESKEVAFRVSNKGKENRVH